MPHKHSTFAFVRRYERALRRGFVSQRSSRRHGMQLDPSHSQLLSCAPRRSDVACVSDELKALVQNTEDCMLTSLPLRKVSFEMSPSLADVSSDSEKAMLFTQPESCAPRDVFDLDVPLWTETCSSVPAPPLQAAPTLIVEDSYPPQPSRCASSVMSDVAAPRRVALILMELLPFPNVSETCICLLTCCSTCLYIATRIYSDAIVRTQAIWRGVLCRRKLCRLACLDVAAGSNVDMSINDFCRFAAELRESRIPASDSTYAFKYDVGLLRETPSAESVQVDTDQSRLPILAIRDIIVPLVPLTSCVTSPFRIDDFLRQVDNVQSRWFPPRGTSYAIKFDRLVCGKRPIVASLRSLHGRFSSKPRSKDNVVVSQLLSICNGFIDTCPTVTRADPVEESASEDDFTWDASVERYLLNAMGADVSEFDSCELEPVEFDSSCTAITSPPSSFRLNGKSVHRNSHNLMHDSHVAPR
eukprot:TRINITY_DN10146_c0_g1_i1.p1 TRINITY_DN10146_c0_g1~~TRINITY_DN10146_c0_g1_i1.p1  ORF type:complete len:471 (-),score=39.20 TRINITY_DN10146_c0_g1_i1:36-1448(-)